VLWEFNRFLPENPCQTGTLAKTLLLIFIDVAILATISIILPPAPSVLQEGSPDACVYTRGSVRRASGFVLTGNPESELWRVETMWFRLTVSKANRFKPSLWSAALTCDRAQPKMRVQGHFTMIARA